MKTKQISNKVEKFPERAHLRALQELPISSSFTPPLFSIQLYRWSDKPKLTTCSSFCRNMLIVIEQGNLENCCVSCVGTNDFAVQGVAISSSSCSPFNSFKNLLLGVRTLLESWEGWDGRGQQGERRKCQSLCGQWKLAQIGNWSSSLDSVLSYQDPRLQLKTCTKSMLAAILRHRPKFGAFLVAIRWNAGAVLPNTFSKSRIFNGKKNVW